MAELSDYEKLRIANILRNEAEMKTLGIDDTKQTLAALSRPQPKAPPRPRVPRPKGAPPTRCSPRDPNREPPKRLVDEGHQSSAPPAKQAKQAKKVRSSSASWQWFRSRTTSAARGDTRKSHSSPLGDCYCKSPGTLTCKRCGVTKVKLDFKDVGFDVNFVSVKGRSYFYVLKSEDAVKKPWSK